MKATCNKCDFKGNHLSVLKHAENTGHGVYVYGDSIFQKTINITLDNSDFRKEMLDVISKRLIEFYKDMEKTEEFCEKFTSLEGDDVEDTWNLINKKHAIDNLVLEHIRKISGIDSKKQPSSGNDNS